MFKSNKTESKFKNAQYIDKKKNSPLLQRKQRDVVE